VSVKKKVKIRRHFCGQQGWKIGPKQPKFLKNFKSSISGFLKFFFVKFITYHTIHTLIVIFEL